MYPSEEQPARTGMGADQILPRDVEIRGRCSEVEGCLLAAGPQSHSCDLQELQAAAQEFEFGFEFECAVARQGCDHIRKVQHPELTFRYSKRVSKLILNRVF